MEIKKILSAFLFSIMAATLAFAQSTEEQRKYKLVDRSSLLETLDSSGTLDGFEANYHSDYTYYDIYLDTEKFDLYKQSMSLRFRKRNYSDTVVAYGFQLKNEMTDFGSVRMEVEEDELDFYMVQKGNSWVSLEEILDLLFAQVENGELNFDSSECKEAITLLREWITFKAAGTVAPFQKLRHLNFDLASIQSLRPVSIGQSNRARLSIYVNDKVSSKAVADILNSSGRTLTSERQWVIEASVDSATFYSLIPSKMSSASIVEFEMENKYDPKSIGTLLMDYFEKRLAKEIELIPFLDSKYRQSFDAVEPN